MQRAEVLLQKLNEQILSNAAASHILVTLQLLQREYLQKAETEIPTDSTVSVVLPYSLADPTFQSGNESSGSKHSEGEDIVDPTTMISNFNELVVDIAVNTEQVSEPHSFIIESFQNIEKNENLISQEINDQLKQSSSAVVDILSDVPVRELKKAIGINDRYLFINELFNGDEAMFDRSLKTLDQFVLLQDAEAWIKRELSVKIGWKEDNPVVRQFGLLLKRRFT